MNPPLILGYDEVVLLNREMSSNRCNRQISCCMDDSAGVNNRVYACLWASVLG